MTELAVWEALATALEAGREVALAVVVGSRGSSPGHVGGLMAVGTDGQLAGTVVAGLGLGVLNKLLEGWAGAVLAKIMVLVFIVIFIQKRPQGIFAVKGRTAD